VQISQPCNRTISYSYTPSGRVATIGDSEGRRARAKRCAIPPTPCIALPVMAMTTVAT